MDTDETKITIGTTDDVRWVRYWSAYQQRWVTVQLDRVDDADIASMSDQARARIAHARSGRPGRGSRYDQYLHEYLDANGQRRYAVGEFSNGQYTCPLSRAEARLTGCHTQFGSRPADLGGYRSRERALRRARYLFA